MNFVIYSKLILICDDLRKQQQQKLTTKKNCKKQKIYFVKFGYITNKNLLKNGCYVHTWPARVFMSANEEK